MSQIDLQIGHKIRSKRRKIGISQANMAKKLSISPSYLNLIESGKRNIDGDLLIKISQELRSTILTKAAELEKESKNKKKK